jgi:hypothetical protein
VEPRVATIEVVGVPAGDIAALRGRAPSEEEWTALLRVTVAEDGQAAPPAGNGIPALAGSYAMLDERLVFAPRFGLDAGRRYRVDFDPSRLPAVGRNDAWRRQPVVAFVSIPKPETSPSTVVTHVHPSAGVIPENQLRLYIHFSAPMGLRGGLDFIRLLDQEGQEVVDPFLPLDAEFWNGDRTRFTVFFDPGRVKRGVLPNEQMGRSLVAGRGYTLVVSREWRDADGLPLTEDFRRALEVGPPDERPLDVKTWRVEPPPARTREPLVVTFPEPLDHGLLLRALGVTTAKGVEVSGDIRIESEETRWIFIPREPWSSGEYRLLTLTFLEDLAGNRIGRAFEVDRFDRADRQPEAEAIHLPFRVQTGSAR